MADNTASPYRNRPGFLTFSLRQPAISLLSNVLVRDWVAERSSLRPEITYRSK
jgi:hypothetical protein